MNLVIDLQDQDGKSHKTMKIELQNQATIDHFQVEVRSVFHIERNFQEILNNDRRIDLLFGTVEEAGVKPNDMLIVKHSMLPMWDELLRAFEEFKNTNLEEYKKSLYKNANRFMTILDETEFFACYPKHLSNKNKIHKTISTYYDRTRGAIEESAKKYFQIIYRGSRPKITFGSRLEGSRRGCIAYVEVNGETTKYHIKTHHGGGARDSHTSEDLDLKELFVYMLLERLGIGANIHFIPNNAGSRWILFIGSREIPNFKTIKDLELLEPQNLVQYREAAVQMLSLYTILNLQDHHSDNMGIDDKGCPYIIDFFLIERGSIDVKTCFYDKIRQAEKMNELLGRLTFSERVRIAKEYFKKNDFVEAFKTETLNLFWDEKMKFDELKFFFKDQKKTEDLKTYMEKVKENVLKFDEFQLENVF